MSALRESLGDYLRVRRALGYKLVREEKLLAQLLDFLAERGEQRLTTEAALAWATLPAGGAAWRARRLSVARSFATYLHAIDPASEVPAADLLPQRPQRATPYLYSDEQIAALIAGAGTLRPAHRAATYQTLIGLLVVTGMRISEAIALDREDLDARNATLLVRSTKFGKSRELALHESTVTAVRRYLRRRDRPQPSNATRALLVSTAGSRLWQSNAQHTFRALLRDAAIGRRSGSCRPRLHDLRHSFAVATILDGYRAGEDVTARIALLSTYLGHVDPAKTYWYLSAAPELMQLAAERLERHLEGQP